MSVFVVPETPFQFMVIVISQYSEFKSISQDEVIDIFNKYGIFNYLFEFFDILKGDRQLFWKIEEKIKDFSENFEKST